MKFRFVLFLLLAVISTRSFAQVAHDNGSDAQVAEQYVKWAEKAIEEDRWTEALTALERAFNFANESSDISYLLAVARFHEKKDRHEILGFLDKAIETNRWVNYSEEKAQILKAKQYVGMKRFSNALDTLNQIIESSDAAVLRIQALSGMASVPDNVHELAQFRSLVLTYMDRYPRDPRPPRIFLEYARNRKPDISASQKDLPENDLNLLELVLRRLAFLLETDPDLAWLAAPFMREEDASRQMQSYRTGNKQNPASIPVALNLGLIDDFNAIEELFAFSPNEEPVLDKDIITEVDSLLRSEEGRNLLTQKLLAFSGVIVTGDNDGYFKSKVSYRSGIIQEAAFDQNTDGIVEMRITFSGDNVPVSAEYKITAEPFGFIQWDRYPSVGQVTLAEEKFLFRPAGFQHAPVSIMELGGSKNYSGLLYPVQVFRYYGLTRGALVSFCESIVRPSVEIKGAEERIFLENGIPWQAVETLDGMQVSITEFERGVPTVQKIDLDLDGRMETIRRFRKLDVWVTETFNYRSLIVSSQSDWNGDGQYKTGEVYLLDGSVVYTWDMDGTGVMREYNEE